jgi:TRAP-type C4-dicarboxylate transport system substrate-binding protein
MQAVPFRRRLGGLAVLAAAIAALVMAGCGGSGGSGGASGGSSSAAKETNQKLKFAYFLGEKTTFGQLWSWWMDEVEKRSEGTITFDRFWDGTLLKGEEMAEGLRDGRVDVAQVTPPMYPGKFPLTSVTELPFASNNVPAGAAAINKLAQENEALKNEYSSQHLVPLAFNIASPSALGTKKPIRTVEDLKGTKLRGIDRQSRLLKAAGANLVNMGPADIYAGIERGLINGFNGIPFGFVGALKFPEVAKYYTDLGMGITTANPLSMSEQGWSRLSARQQQVIREVSAEIPAKIAQFDTAAEDATCQVIKAEHATISILPEPEVAKLRKLGEPVVADWTKEAGGAQAEQFRQEWLDAVKAAEGEYPDYELGMHRCMEQLGTTD